MIGQYTDKEGIDLLEEYLSKSNTADAVRFRKEFLGNSQTLREAMDKALASRRERENSGA